MLVVLQPVDAVKHKPWLIYWETRTNKLPVRELLIKQYRSCGIFLLALFRIMGRHVDGASWCFANTSQSKHLAEHFSLLWSSQKIFIDPNELSWLLEDNCVNFCLFTQKVDGESATVFSARVEETVLIWRWSDSIQIWAVLTQSLHVYSEDRSAKTTWRDHPKSGPKFCMQYYFTTRCHSFSMSVKTKQTGFVQVLNRLQCNSTEHLKS